MTKLDSFLQKLIVLLFSSLFFLVPLFFTPFNSELFEFNKMILVYVFATLIVGAWLGRMIRLSRILFKRTPLDIPLILFLASQIVSTIFSIDRHTSIFGYYSRFNGGLLSAISYLLLYWALVSNCNSENVLKFIKVTLISGFIVSIYGILEHFGHSFSCFMFEGKFDVSCWVQKVQERVFATLGQPNWLAAYLAVLVPISLGLALNSKVKSQKSKLQFKIKNYHSFFALSLVFYVCLLFTGSRSGFLGLIIALLFFWFLLFLTLTTHPRLTTHNPPSPLKSLIRPFIIFSFTLFALIFIFGSPFPQINKFLYYKDLISHFSPQNPASHISLPTSDQGPQLEVGGSESGQIRKIVWQGAVDIFKHYPLFGSGVETFAYSYYNFRPAEHNLVSEWDFLYNKAHNEYLNYLSTTGIFGLGSYCLFVIIFIFWGLRQIAISLSRYLDKEKKRDNDITSYRDNDLIIALFSAWLSILVSNFFGFSVVIVSLYFYLIPAFIFALNSTHNPPQHLDSQLTTQNSQLSILRKFSLLILLFFIFYLLSFILNLWQADRFYTKGQNSTKQNHLIEGYQNLFYSVSLSPNEPVFLNELSMTTANLALLSFESKDATTSNQLKDSAIAFSDKALAISPKNLNLYKTRTRVFYTLSTIDSRYLDEAIETLNQAIKLAPTDPKLVYNLGLLYGRKEKSQEAFAYFQKAIEMKPNYEEVRNAMALFYEDLDQKEKAIEQLEYILKTKPNDKSTIERIEKLK